MPALLTCAVALLPVVYLVVMAAGSNAGEMIEVLLRPRIRRLLGTTLALAAVVSAASLVLGVGSAWLVERCVFPGRRVFAVLAALPLAVPSYVAAYTWLAAVPVVSGFAGAALVLTLCCSPYVHLAVAAALRGMDPAWEEVARSSGCRPWTAFRRVTLPQLRPAMAAGGLLVATYVLADFGSVSILRVDTVTRSIATALENSFSRLVPTTLSLLLVAVTALVVLGELRSRGRARHARVGSGAARRPARRQLTGPARVLAPAALAGVALASLGVPLASLGWWLTVGRSGAWDLPRLGSAALTSVGYAGGGALLTLALALPVGVLAARHPGRAARWVEGLSWLPHAVPAIVVALALVVLAVRHAPAVYLSPPLLVLAYALLFLPLAVGAVRASVAQSPPALEETARSLGRSPRQVFRSVTVPLAAPGIAAGGLLVFLTGMKELTATLVLHPTGSETLAMRLWTTTEVGQFAAAAPYAAVIVLLAAVPGWYVSRGAERSRGPGG
ncbi:MAG: iron transporter permease [Modestobacter sp.]|nr:iron transporter permease [Modestobacter sp.]